MNEKGEKIWAEAKPFYEALVKESERGGMLIAYEVLEGLLKELLKTLLVTSDGTGQRRRQFIRQIHRLDACFFLGLIGTEQHTHLDIIRQIRNLCGHTTTEIGFEDEGISNLISELHEVIPEIAQHEPNDATQATRNRARFLFNVALQFAHLKHLIETAQSAGPIEESCLLPNLLSARVHDTRQELAELREEREAKLKTMQDELVQLKRDEAKRLGKTVEEIDLMVEEMLDKQEREQLEAPQSDTPDDVAK